MAVLPAMLAKVGLPFLLKTVAGSLKKLSNPVAKNAVDALAAVEDAMTNGALSGDDLREANRHIETIAGLNNAQFNTLITQINESLRAEIASQDMYVRRMRPTFGYIIAVTWAAQMLAVAFVILDNPERAPILLDGLGQLDTIWTVGLSVLGIYVYRRSGEKTKY
jgi:hypothetical protein